MVNKFNELEMAIAGLIVIYWLTVAIPFCCMYFFGNRAKNHANTALVRTVIFAVMSGAWLYIEKYEYGVKIHSKHIPIISAFAFFFLGLCVAWLYIPLTAMIKNGASSSEINKATMFRVCSMTLLLLLFGIPFSSIELL